MTYPSRETICEQRELRAGIISRCGGLKASLDQGLIPMHASLTLSEALVIGLVEQGVKIFYAVLGHGSTEVAEVLRIYQRAGLLRVYGLRSEIEASHAAAALRWVTGEKAAVVTSIGPGALQALAASLVAASDGLGVWYLFGDETTEDEGFNMQQIPYHNQGSFLKMMSVMGETYSLHTPGSLPACLMRGAVKVDHPYRPGPFYVLMPMNTQGIWMENFNLREIPGVLSVKVGRAEGDYQEAARLIRSSKKVIVKVGGGGRYAGKELIRLVKKSGAVLVHTPIASGCIPYSYPANMGVGGSKGSICGNYAMENADLLIAVGTRAVCQSDSSRTAYPNVRQVININAEIEDAAHYNCSLQFVGDVSSTLEQLNKALEVYTNTAEKEAWLKECHMQKQKWQSFKDMRAAQPVLFDEYWKKAVLTQPAAIKTAIDWAKRHEVVTFFDAGDVQANAFQMNEDDHPNHTFTETGASYMGFAVSALLVTGTAAKPFYGLAVTGDGSFTMNPQILIDGREFAAAGCILLLDNGRMGAISGLQKDQYGQEFASSQVLHVDYLAWARAVPGVLAIDGGLSIESLARALEQAWEYPGLALVHVPVYYGADELGGLGVYGRWNVGNWCEDTQKLRHEIGL